MPQLQINQGPQDALLYDNSKSYFTNVGYTRTSNFQVEYRKVEPQNNPSWGSTVQFVIPKAADLLGPVDLEVDLPAPTASGFTGGGTSFGTNQEKSQYTKAYAQWIDEVGFAMLEKITFSVGSNDIETLTGEQLQIKNELMTSDEMRLGYDAVLKTGKAAFNSLSADRDGSTDEVIPGEVIGTALKGTVTADNSAHSLSAANNGKLPDGMIKRVNKDNTRLIELLLGSGETTDSTASPATTAKLFYLSADKRKLIIPLGLFFTKHVSQYFPLSAVAGCNDVRISIKLRQLSELVQVGGVIDTGANAFTSAKLPTLNLESSAMRLMCHYVHVTGPEAQVLMNKEHVRLLKLYQHQSETFSTISSGTLDLNLSFLHPVSTLIITIRAVDDLTTSEGATYSESTTAVQVMDGSAGGRTAMGKGRFFYHGDGTNPNYDRYPHETASALPATTQGQGTLKVDSISLSLNGQERHPGLSKGIETDYLRTRLLPMLHSNSNQVQKQNLGLASTGAVGTFSSEAAAAYGQQGSKNIFVYPFSLNPEGSNPSGAVNFSKVSHAKLSLHLDTTSNGVSDSPLELTSGLPSNTGGFRVDVYALYYNWLQIRDGRALLSFA